MEVLTSRPCLPALCGLIRPALNRCVAFLLLAASTAASFAQGSREEQLKGVLLYNLIQFVEWPPSTLSDMDTPFTIGVMADDQFADLLTAIVQNERVNGRRILVERYRSRGALGPCHLLFIGSDRGSLSPEALSRIKGQPILTVSDSSQFILQGGMVRFYRSQEDKIRIEINLDAVKAANLSMSAKLLRVAKIVGRSPNGE